jgi:antitoxin component YwqK of YwqJK toxin-antitoxin module
MIILRFLTLIFFSFFILNSSYAQVKYERVTFKPEPYVEYHKNGKVHKKGYINSKREFVDTLKVYNPSGKLAMTAVYDKGVPQGKCVHYREDGSISMEGIYVEGKKEGLWRYRNYAQTKEGVSFHFSVNYKKGKLHGETILYMGKYKSRVVHAYNGIPKNSSKWEMYYDNSKEKLWAIGYVNLNSEFTLRGLYTKDGKFIDKIGVNEEKTNGYLKSMKDFFDSIPK